MIDKLCFDDILNVAQFLSFWDILNLRLITKELKCLIDPYFKRKNVSMNYILRLGQLIDSSGEVLNIDFTDDQIDRDFENFLLFPSICCHFRDNKLLFIERETDDWVVSNSKTFSIKITNDLGNLIYVDSLLTTKKPKKKFFVLAHFEKGFVKIRIQLNGEPLIKIFDNFNRHFFHKLNTENQRKQIAEIFEKQNCFDDRNPFCLIGENDALFTDLKEHINFVFVDKENSELIHFSKVKNHFSYFLRPFSIKSNGCTMFKELRYNERTSSFDYIYDVYWYKIKKLIKFKTNDDVCIFPKFVDIDELWCTTFKFDHPLFVCSFLLIKNDGTFWTSEFFSEPIIRDNSQGYLAFKTRVYYNDDGLVFFVNNHVKIINRRENLKMTQVFFQSLDNCDN